MINLKAVEREALRLVDRASVTGAQRKIFDATDVPDPAFDVETDLAEQRRVSWWCTGRHILDPQCAGPYLLRFILGYSRAMDLMNVDDITIALQLDLKGIIR